MIFLLGPPGAGKTSLGTRACDELGLTFHDLTSGEIPANEGKSATTDASDEERLRSLIDARAADVIEIPWTLQSERNVRALLRKSGVSLLLWDHPLHMIARSGGRARALLTPVPRLRGRGGFGSTGAPCREFRRLDRTCTDTLMLVDLSFDLATRALKEFIQGITQPDENSPTDRERLGGWAEAWCQDYDADPQVAATMVDAMARYVSHLRSSGTSPRTLAGVLSDLNAAGHLVLMYEVPTPRDVLNYFDAPPFEFEFKRKFNDSRTAMARYSRSLEGFARFLKDNRSPKRK
jgi:hypothetical protein